MAVGGFGISMNSRAFELRLTREIGTAPISPGLVAYILNRLEAAPDLAKALRQGGRVASNVCTPITLFEGYYDATIIAQCAFGML